MPLSTERKKQLRTIGHKLNPIVTIADRGLTDSVLAELNRALDDHELIKVKLALTERESRHEAVALLQDMRGVEVVQQVRSEERRVGKGWRGRRGRWRGR